MWRRKCSPDSAHANERFEAQCVCRFFCCRFSIFTKRTKTEETFNEAKNNILSIIEILI